MPENEIQSRGTKICEHCGTENEWQRGQCISCGRTDFLSKPQRQKGRKEGVSDILTSVFLVGISFYVLYITRDKIFVEKWVLPIILLLFIVSVGSLINGIYKFRHARNILIWHIILLAIVIPLVLWEAFR